MPKPPKRRERLTSKESDKILGIPSKDAGLSRRERAKLRRQKETENEIHGTTVENLKPRLLESTRHGRGDSSKLLTSEDPKEITADIKIVEQSIQRGWNVRRKALLRNRLEEIALKTKGDVVTKDGIVKSETIADKLSIDAIKVLAQMDKNDVERVKNSKPVPDNKPVVNVNVGIDARTAKYFELARSLGVRELIIDGRRVETGSDPLTVNQASEGRTTTENGT